MTRRTWFGWAIGTVLAIPGFAICRPPRPRWAASSLRMTKAEAIGFARACGAEAWIDGRTYR
jgi:hypothetical protein